MSQWIVINETVTHIQPGDVPAINAARHETDQQHHRLVAHYLKSHELEPHEKQALDYYTGAGSAPLTNFLLNGHRRRDLLNNAPEIHRRFVAVHETLHSFMDRSPTAPETVHAYSSIGPSFHGRLMKRAPGTLFRSPAWVSTTNRPMSFTYNTAHFHIPEGSKMGAYIDHVSVNPSENEFLLRAGTRWTYKGNERVGGPGEFEGGFLHHFEPTP